MIKTQIITFESILHMIYKNCVYIYIHFSGDARWGIRGTKNYNTAPLPITSQYHDESYLTIITNHLQYHDHSFSLSITFQYHFTTDHWEYLLIEVHLALNKRHLGTAVE